MPVPTTMTSHSTASGFSCSLTSCSSVAVQDLLIPGEFHMLHAAILETDGDHSFHLIHEPCPQAFGCNYTFNPDRVTLGLDFIDSHQTKVCREAILMPLLDAFFVPERADVELQHGVIG